jgi:hypothetical protein
MIEYTKGTGREKHESIARRQHILTVACHIPDRLLMLVRFSLSAIRASSRRFLSAAVASSPSLQAEKTLGDAELARASRRDADMRANYEDVPSEYPAHAQPSDPAAKVDKLQAYRKRMIYRSKQRGWSVNCSTQSSAH